MSQLSLRRSTFPFLCSMKEDAFSFLRNQSLCGCCLKVLYAFILSHKFRKYIGRIYKEETKYTPKISEQYQSECHNRGAISYLCVCDIYTVSSTQIKKRVRRTEYAPQSTFKEIKSTDSGDRALQGSEPVGRMSSSDDLNRHMYCMLHNYFNIQNYSVLEYWWRPLYKTT